eukprot:ctg_1946.g534
MAPAVGGPSRPTHPLCSTEGRTQCVPLPTRIPGGAARNINSARDALQKGKTVADRVLCYAAGHLVRFDSRCAVGAGGGHGRCVGTASGRGLGGGAPAGYEKCARAVANRALVSHAVGGVAAAAAAVRSVRGRCRRRAGECTHRQRQDAGVRAADRLGLGAGGAAAQVEAVFRVLCAGEEVAAAVQLVTAAKDRPPRQTVALRCSAVFITTCGHLLDLLESDAIDLRYLRWLVLDEADRLFQQSGHEWLGRVLRTAGHGSGLMYPPLKPLRKVLLSATQTQEAEHLARLQLQWPVFYAYRWGEGSEGAADNSRPRRLSRAPSTLQSVSVVCAAEAEKLELLLRMAGYVARVGNANRLLSAHDRVVIFTKSVSAAHRLTRFLQLALEQLPHQPCVENDAATGVSAGHVAEFSRQLAPVARARMLQRLRDRSLQYLVCSDVMARGIDVLSVDAVVNYDVPAHVTTFVHRVGRTARAGQSGTCYTLLLERQQAYFEREIQGPALGGDVERVFVHRAHELLEETQRAAVSMHCRRILRAVRLVLEAERWSIVPADEPLSAEWCAYALRYAGSAQESAPQEPEPQARLQQTLHSVALRNWLS